MEIINKQDIEQRLLNKTNKTSSCWIWTGASTKAGYGRIRINGKLESTHRVAFELYNGRILKDMMICHECDNPSCVNPKHLWAGTRSDNMSDAYKKGRINKCCLKNDHNGEKSPNSKLTNSNVKFIRNNKCIISAKELANKFQIHPRTIEKIWYKETWKNV